MVLEKEGDWAQHQSGNNSGVIHSGIYYRPGSLKARLACAGNRSMVAFCREHGVAHEVCGKVIVATEPGELPRLAALEERGRENGLEVSRFGPEEVRDLEPHVRCLAGIRVPTTGIVDYRQVCRKYVDLIRRDGGELRLGVRVEKITRGREGLRLETGQEVFTTQFIVNCAGLHSDRIARMAGVQPPARIVPFRGEYYELRAEKRHLVRNLVYPVPDPDFPFLGVHFTRTIDGRVHAGPNAVLSLKREGYRKSDFDLGDAAEVLAYAGFWRLAARHFRAGVREMIRSLSRAAFVRSLQRLVPDVQSEDLVPARSGVRAQALAADGALVDDFLIVRGPNSLHVCNAPSPAATASIEIGRAIVEQIPQEGPLPAAQHGREREA